MDRKALIDAYKNRKSRQGIFQIRNLKNGKIFLESSTDLDKIENRHRFQLNMGGHPCSGLQADWKTYGDAAFVFETLYELDIPEDPAYDVKKELKLLEQMHLEELQPYGEKGYHQAKTSKE
ncbi:MAG: GIY-YIG nuclease family protein [Lewinellaceae bacterium]|nr:GIY-YIG nuclease family protein [Lewinellaceae bacterium]